MKTIYVYGAGFDALGAVGAEHLFRTRQTWGGKINNYEKNTKIICIGSLWQISSTTVPSPPETSSSYHFHKMWKTNSSKFVFWVFLWGSKIICAGRHMQQIRHRTYIIICPKWIANIMQMKCFSMIINCVVIIIVI